VIELSAEDSVEYAGQGEAHSVKRVPLAKAVNFAGATSRTLGVFGHHHILAFYGPAAGEPGSPHEITPDNKDYR